MKKTLILMALLGGMTAQAEIVSVFAEGFTDDASCRANAYHNEMVGNMCWGANAANLMAWWQDQLKVQGYNLPANVPEGYSIYSEYQSAFPTTGGYTDRALEWWLDGDYPVTSYDSALGGHYRDLVVQPRKEYKDDGSTLIGQSSPGNEGGLTDYASFVVDSLRSGRALAIRVGAANITVWGAKYNDETGLLTQLYYADPHEKGTSSKIYCGDLTPATDTAGVSTYFLHAMDTLAETTTITCRIDEFLTEAAYTDKGSGAFAPFGNVELDSGTSYTIAKAVKAAAEGSALEGKANGDLTIKNGTAILADGASIQGKVIFSPGSSEGARTLSVQADGLTLSSVKVDSDTNNTLEVTDGNDVTISSMIGEGTLVKTGVGTLVNGGTLGNIELQGGTLKGSGSFASLTMNGGTLIVGNSPGRQTYTEALTVNMGDIVFSVGGWKTAADSEQFGWDSGTYSNIMLGEGGALTLGEGANVKFAVGGEALATLLSGKGGFSMDIATGIGNTGYFSSDLLRQLALQTKFYIATEEGAAINNSNELSAGADLTTRIYNLAYNLKDGGVLSVSGSFEQQVIPEPATGSLGLLALAGLCIRRRRK